MPPHNDNEHSSHGPAPEEIDASHGYELRDVRVTGIVVFLTALAIFVAVSGVLCYGIGKVINAAMKKEDGPTSRWSKTVEVRDLGNLPNNPELQNRMAQLTQQFPTPRVQTDDGNEDVADLHQREDLLLDHYTRIDGQPGKVRIPIERAMELIAQRGLPVSAAAEKSALMAGDKEPAVQAPLTSGFARTAYELEEIRNESAAEAHPAGGK